MQGLFPGGTWRFTEFRLDRPQNGKASLGILAGIFGHGRVRASERKGFWSGLLSVCPFKWDWLCWHAKSCWSRRNNLSYFVIPCSFESRSLLLWRKLDSQHGFGKFSLCLSFSVLETS